MKLFEANRKDCAKYLLGIPNSFEPNYFKPPSEDDNGSDRMDDDKSMDTEESGWSLSDLLVEVMLFCIDNIYNIFSNHGDFFKH
jgi:nuclear cap-binding protein subunit 1